MKKVIIVSLCLFFFLFVGCQKDTVAPEITIIEDDVADAIGSALASSSKGLISQLGIGADIADSGELPLFAKFEAAAKETTVTRQGSFGGYSYQYTVRYRYEFSLLNDSMNFQYWLKGVYSTPRMSSDDSSWADLRFTQFIGRDTCMINGTYNRLGSQALKIRDQKQFTSQITATLSNIAFDKVTKRAVRGFITLTVDGQSSTGNAFLYSGVLSIYGDIASLILNDLTYEVDLTTGIATWIPDEEPLLKKY